MRLFVPGLIAMFAITGCATVSMVPGSAIVEAKATPEQTALRDASDAFIEKTEEAQWVTRTSGIIDLAKVLMDGRSGDEVSADSYADVIEANSADALDVRDRLLSDIGEAASSLRVVNEQSQIAMQRPPVSKSSLRKNVVSFEGALVAAQKSRRSFVNATSIVAERSDMDISLIDAELAAFDKVIDTTRSLVDALADMHVEPADTDVTS